MGHFSVNHVIGKNTSVSSSPPEPDDS